MAGLTLKGIYKKYPGGVVAVSDVNLEIRDKEFIVLVGPSGCGKSTTLRMIAGLEEISEGELYIGDRLVNDIAPKDRDIAMVFQNYALYPHMTVFDNMAFGLKLRKVPKAEIERKVNEAAKILDLTHLLDRKPKAMSGGQRQRVALGRAIVRSPKVFLLDEPLSNLDAKLRAQMRTEIAKIHKKLGTTFIYVTHDQTEAMTMGDRIVCMKDGFVQQIDTPQNLYENPVNKFVAGFLGSPQMNFIDAELKEEYGQFIVEFGATNGRGNRYQIIVPESKVNEDLGNYVGKEIILGVRPESIHDEEMYLSNASTGVIDANVEITEMMGAETYLYLLCEGIPLTARVSPRSTARPGDDIKVAIDPNRIHIFDKETEKAIVN
ncbi:MULTISPECIES: ABC transporter ATP-binding protein [Ruminococcus]|jgi:multiple sugar transport system ATP-binding protein|uniref:Multiple sugar transport system ATP-binding protein n=1 Tax=Ruminococcus flavefaciens TaxID=1265 RepID=A0A315XVD3_RUMFL|nr:MULTISPECIES: sn-glycerol-3-phosphate ABC transporter ATP-binding protein UgpC [Ruminococcus]MBQ6168738.1 sn-glycerol-3-phosphate ABC transporter ATP-binding protein UgpC [Ruminococcus sp.]MBQ6252824.1 sn-glycerol-3-phosphate ABC transporter ATP-binding protein UgpC [Ruminococcus sp.]MBR1432057.1 sn-glycerol-3-phosphate ABC transporter ATP-binding protein UgpC [Ruminococcus sp.]MBR3666608.1 sn-glycerol-3-phosphate ABC transporter ATP-binding protein UgpC [Ruminococcus sp.]MBR6995094.1 sn-gl